MDSVLRLLSASRHPLACGPWYKSVIQNRLANWLRFVLGLVLALGVGVYFRFTDGGKLLIYGLPAAILLITIADFIGYLRSSQRENRS